MKIFSRNVNNAKCYSFYTFGFKRPKSRELYLYSLDLFEKLTCSPQYMSYYTEDYQIRYGKFEKMKRLIESEKWDEVVHFELDDKDVRDSTRRLSIEFNITRPDMLTVLLSDGIDFDVKLFCTELYDIFKVIYGFSYRVEMSEWATAYAKGDWQHSRGVHFIDRISKDDLQLWNNKCESITDGLVRDIYQENILSKAHLSRLINNITLGQFIKNNGKGELESINSELYVWLINSEECIKEMRKVVYKSKLLI